MSNTEQSTTAALESLRKEAREVSMVFASQPDAILSANPAHLLAMADKLASMNDFSHARQVVAWARLAPVTDLRMRQKLGQRHTLYTYKDSDLPVRRRLDRALEIIGETDDLANTTNQETLGLAGSIHKRMWEIENRRDWLEASLAYYMRGFQAGAGSAVPPDEGYTGINAAFVLDLLAAQENGTGAPGAIGQIGESAFTTQADAVRRSLVRGLTPRLDATPNDAPNVWLAVTLAEAHLGLRDWDRAAELLRVTRNAGAMSRWQIEASARQLAILARLRDPKARAGERDAPSWRALRELVGDDDAGLRSAFTGKIGLALSGGGFRASFFHIGVLARLAELGVLPGIEVLSCVSGGSIVGAHYYLMLRQMLSTRPDASITASDYMKIVEQLETDFLAGVQRNIRTRALAELTTSVRMIFQPNYTRTRRLGELYEKLLYSRVPDNEGSAPRWINELRINPQGKDFNPRRDNWSRQAKIPMLILNATTLNTGHNWQFTASYMGEPPAAIDEEVDANDRLRRMYYTQQAPSAYKRVRLGHAVAASSCVPGLFEPLNFPELYPGRTVSLVDGGVHDNQGAASLLEQDCSVLLVSDASGQMESDAYPSGTPFRVLVRSNDVLMARVRGSQFRDLATRRRSWLLRGLMFLHLRKDLDVVPVSWIDYNDPIDPDDAATWTGAGTMTTYGIPKRIQALIAGIRTDLDSFSETEASSLMLSGYQMAAEFRACVPHFPTTSNHAPTPPWRFLRLEQAIAESESEAANTLAALLQVSASRFFKLWRSPSAGFVLTLLVCWTIGIALGWWLGPYVFRHARAILPWIIGLLLVLVAWGGVRIGRFGESAGQVATGMVLGVLGVIFWPVNRLHLHLFDRFYLARGAVKRVLKRVGPSSVRPSEPDTPTSTTGATAGNR